MTASTSSCTRACFEAWINCENLLDNLLQAKTSLSKKVIKIVDECALICMETFHAIKSSSQNISRFALLCVGICEECAEYVKCKPMKIFFSAPEFADPAPKL